MKEKLRIFMMGRYGNDQLNRFLLLLCLVVLVISCFIQKSMIWLLGFVLVGLVYFRMLSRNILRRRQENERYLRLKAGFCGGFRYYRCKIRDRKSYSYFRCPVCRTPLRVPRGRGRIMVVCKNCKHEFERMS